MAVGRNWEEGERRRQVEKEKLRVREDRGRDTKGHRPSQRLSAALGPSPTFPGGNLPFPRVFLIPMAL